MNAIRNTSAAPTRKTSVDLLNFSAKQTRWNILTPKFIRLHLLDELVVTNQLMRSAQTAPPLEKSPVSEQQLSP